MPSDILGPTLILDHADTTHMHLAAICVAPTGTQIAPLLGPSGSCAFAQIAQVDGQAVFRARFSVPLDHPARYSIGGAPYDITAAGHGDMRIGFASCNGEEIGDLEREGSERNAMWARLCAEHRSRPFALLIHGGDQIYADEATRDHPVSAGWPDDLPRDPARADLDDLRAHLRRRFFERYVGHMRCPELAWLSARIPSLSQWDDHDICDGWGSLRRSRTYSALGQLIFDVAREMALLFQHGTVDGDLPDRFHDRDGQHLGWIVDLPGLRVLGPDLRSERTRRQIMGPGGWAMMEDVATRPAPARTILVSSVPLLGPRLSYLEAIMVAVPGMSKYEDDLRDQWQSRAHRNEWRRMLFLLSRMAEVRNTDITSISGEIHLATRAEMSLRGGHVLHQLVASGVAHRPPPQGWARFLGLLSRLGENPLPHRPVRIRALPGQPRPYVAERNTLCLERVGDSWSATWDLEHAGRTPPLPL